jgi:hypothetical protein
MHNQRRRFRAASASIFLAIIVTWTQSALSQTGGGIFLPLVSGGSRSLATVTPVATRSAPSPTPNATAAPTTWIFCANQYSGCSYIGKRTVRFGANGVYVYADLMGEGISCDSGSFEGRVPNVASPRCEYSSNMLVRTINPPSTDNHSMHTVVADLTKIPLGHPGFSTARVQTTTEQASPSGDGVGAFRTVCQYSHMSFDDPIVYPGQTGRAHLHAFFGNTAVDANSTASSIANSGNSTCRGGTINRSGYWVPALIDTRTGTPIVPKSGIFYYKSGYGGVRPQDIKPMPRGLRMIAGNMSAGVAADAPHQGWECLDTPGSNGKSIPTNCRAGAELQMTINFPQCWNGRDLDSPDHRSHMAYPDRGCPSTHPIALPEITVNIRYVIDDAAAFPHLRLSSDMYGPSVPGGWSAHADWFDGWEQSANETFVRECTGAPADCHAHLLGNGKAMY